METKQKEYESHIGSRNYGRTVARGQFTGISTPNVSPVPGAAYLTEARKFAPGSSSASSVSISSTITVSSAGVYFVDATSGNIVISLASVATFQAGAALSFFRVDSGSNTVTIVPSGAETINSATSITLPYQNHELTLWANTSTWRAGYPTNQELADSSYSGLASNDLTYWNGTRFANRTVPSALGVVLTTNGDLLTRVAGAVTRLAIGSSNDMLVVSSGLPAWTTLALELATMLTSNGDIIYRNGSGVVARLPVGTNGDLLTTSSGLPAWTTLALELATMLTSNGDIIYRNGSGVVTRLPVGTNGDLLTTSSGLPTWTTLALELATMLTSNGDIIYRNGSGVVARLPVGTNGDLLTTSSSLPAWVSKTTLKLTVPLFDHFADANNSGTGETDLYSDTLAAGQLDANGDKVYTQYGGIFSGDATSTQRLRVYFGGTLVLDSGALGVGAGTTSWDIQMVTVRVSSSVVRCSCKLTTSFVTLMASSTYTEVTGLTLANTQIVKVTGQAAGATGGSNQITSKEGYITYTPAA